MCIVCARVCVCACVRVCMCVQSWDGDRFSTTSTPAMVESLIIIAIALAQSMRPAINDVHARITVNTAH